MCEPRTCAVCPEPITRREGERVSKWRERMTCSTECLRKLQRKRAAVPAEPEPVRICARPGCGNAMERRISEARKQWSRRRYCSVSCAQIAKPSGIAARRPDAKPPETLKCCVNCSRPVPWQAWMDEQSYAAQTTCLSPKCLATVGRRRTPSEPHELAMKNIVAEMHLRVGERRILAYLAAGDEERRLFSPLVASLAEARMSGR